MMSRPITAALAGLTVAALATAVPAAARITQLQVTGTVLTGTDDGNDLIDVSVVNNVYVHTFAPGNFFGTNGSLVGKSIVFRFVYDTDSAPAAAGGVYDDPTGEWAYSLAPTVAIDGVVHPFYDLVPGTFAFNPVATLTLVDGTSDGLSGHLSGLTFSGNSLSDYRASGFDFSAVLPPSFFATDAALPGSFSGPGYGYAGGHATGSGSFFFSRGTCFIQCSSKLATGTFAVTSVGFADVPEPTAWGLMTIGFGLIGGLTRRQAAARRVCA